MGEDFSIVIPAFNEADRLPGSLAEIRAFFARTSSAPPEILVCDDGSTDGTADVLRADFGTDASIRLLCSDTNQGKGDAVRRGVLAASREYILVSDADLSTPIAEAGKLFTVARTGALAMGSRGLADSLIPRRQPWYRRNMGKLFNTLIRRLLGIPFYDTQCGFKMFSRDVGRELFAVQHVKRFAFDVEIVLRARTRGIACVEVAMRWEHSRPTKVHPIRDASRMLYDAIRLRLLYGRYGAAR